MEDQLKEAIKTLTKKASEDRISSNYAEQYSQAALNLSHALLNVQACVVDEDE